MNTVLALLLSGSLAAAGILALCLVGVSFNIGKRHFYLSSTMRPIPAQKLRALREGTATVHKNPAKGRRKVKA
jgi:hypothetical protein